MQENRHEAINTRLRRNIRELKDKQKAFIEMAEGVLAEALTSIEGLEIFAIDSISVARIETTSIEDPTPTFALGRVRVTVKPLV